MAAAVTVGQIFAASAGKPIADVVLDFDFKKMNVRSESRSDSLHIGLAPSYGKLNSQAIKMMDDELKIMIAGTMKSLSAVPEKERTWEKVMSILMQNPLLEPEGKQGVNRSDKLVKTSSSDFKVDGSPNQTIVKEVQSWFTALINDRDVLDSTKIDINVLGNIVAQTGATIDSFETFFAKSEHHEKTMVDIGVLRFPDTDRPFFQVYRIQLTAWSHSDRILFHQEDSNGITGEYNSRNFVPRKSVIAGLQDKARATAIDMANNLFS